MSVRLSSQTDVIRYRSSLSVFDFDGLYVFPFFFPDLNVAFYLCMQEKGGMAAKQSRVCKLGFFLSIVYAKFLWFLKTLF